MEIYFHILVVHVCWNKNAMCIISNIARLLPWFGQVKNINVSRQNRKSNQSEARGASWVKALQWSGLMWIEHETSDETLEIIDWHSVHAPYYM